MSKRRTPLVLPVSSHSALMRPFRAAHSVCLAALLVYCSTSSSEAASLALGNVILNNGAFRAVVQLEPATGILITNAQVDLDADSGLVLDPNGDIIVMHSVLVDSHPEFIRINPDSGQQTILTNAQLMTEGKAMEWAGDGNLLVNGDARIFDWTTQTEVLVHGLFTVNPNTGAQTLLATNRHPFTWGLAVTTNGTIYVCDAWHPYSLLRYTRDGRTRTGVSVGGYIQYPEGLAIEQDGSVLIADGGTHGIVRVNPNTGDQTVVSSGNFLSWPVGVTVAPDGAIFVTEIRNQNVVKIDPVTGIQTLVAGNLPGGQAIRFVSNARPQLAFRSSGSTITLFWSKAATGLHLEATSGISAFAFWLSVTNTPAQTEWQNELTLPFSPGTHLFRLRNN